MVVAINSTKISLLLNSRIYQSHKHIAFISIIGWMKSCAKKKKHWKTIVCHSLRPTTFGKRKSTNVIHSFRYKYSNKAGKKKTQKNQTKQTTPRFESSNKTLATQPPATCHKILAEGKKNEKRFSTHSLSRIPKMLGGWKTPRQLHWIMKSFVCFAELKTNQIKRNTQREENHFWLV